VSVSKKTGTELEVGYQVPWEGAEEGVPEEGAAGGVSGAGVG